MIREELEIGTHLESATHIILFGNRHSNVESLKRQYPSFEFALMKQTHGNQICHTESSSEGHHLLPEGDSHWTTRAGLALCISTADCLPVFFFDTNSDLIFGIHAGWRGVANRIVPLSIAHARELGARQKDLTVLIGPHIRQASFEVDQPCLHQLQKSVSALPYESDFFIQSGKKYFVDLERIMLKQLSDAGLNESQIMTLNEDTRANINYHSHRRDREKAGRQLSFILRK